MQREIARHLEQEIPDEEQPGRQAEHGLGESEFRAHGQLRQPDIGPVEVVDEIGQAEERNEPATFRTTLASISGFFSTDDMNVSAFWGSVARAGE